MEKKQIQTITVLLGSILAAAVVFAQVFQVKTFIQESNLFKAESNQDTQEKGEELIISIPSISLPTTSTVSLNLEVYYLFETSSEKESPAVEPVQLSLKPHKLFQTLFRVIISPNAP
jgi:hypothetical protein